VVSAIRHFQYVDIRATAFAELTFLIQKNQIKKIGMVSQPFSSRLIPGTMRGLVLQERLIAFESQICQSDKRDALQIGEEAPSEC